MKQVLQNVWKTDRRSFLLILILDIVMGILNSVSIVMLVISFLCCTMSAGMGVISNIIATPQISY